MTFRKSDCRLDSGHVAAIGIDGMPQKSLELRIDGEITHRTPIVINRATRLEQHAFVLSFTPLPPAG